MFEISQAADGTIKLKGRLDATQESRAGEVLDTATGSAVVDFGELSYISSAGLDRSTLPELSSSASSLPDSICALRSPGSAASVSS